MSLDTIKGKLGELNSKTAFAAAAALLAASTIGMGGCAANTGNTSGESGGNQASEVSSAASDESDSESGSGPEYDFSYTDRDQDPSYDDVEATHVTVDGTVATIKGDGVEAADGTLKVTDAGVYVISGNFSGTVDVEAPDDAKVQLVLSNAAIAGGANAINVSSADKVFVTLPDGTSNSLSNSIDDGGEDGSNAALWSDCDLTLQGGGTLSVTSVNDGIKTQDDLVITGGSIDVTAAGDGIVGHDSVKSKDASVTVSAGDGDGIKSSEADKDGKGFVSIDSGTFAIVSTEDDGISAARHVRVAGGTISITSADKGIVSDDTMQVEGGDVVIAAEGDGIHSEFSYVQDGGDIVIETSDEGVEGQEVTVNGGELHIKAKDDGINASKGETAEEKAASSSSTGQAGGFGRMGGDPMGDVADECSITVNGGKVVVDAAGDGLDSNGSINLNGGEIAVSGPSSDGDTAIDSGTASYANGAAVIAIGSSGMFEGFSSDSSEAFVEADVEVGAGDVVALAADGKVIASVSATKRAAKVTASYAGMEEGKVYQIVVNGTFSDPDPDGGATFSGTVSGGTSADVTATRQSSGGGMFGGMMDRGGNMKDGGKFDAGDAPTAPDGQQPPDGDVRGGFDKKDRQGDRGMGGERPVDPRQGNGGSSDMR